MTERTFPARPRTPLDLRIIKDQRRNIHRVSVSKFHFHVVLFLKYVFLHSGSQNSFASGSYISLPHCLHMVREVIGLEA